MLNLVIPMIDEFTRMAVAGLQVLGVMKPGQDGQASNPDAPTVENDEEYLDPLTKEQVAQLTDDKLEEYLALFEEEVMTIV